MHHSNYNPEIHHRRSIRLKGYDYTTPGFYFVTICAKNGSHIFGKIIDKKMVLSEYGKILDQCWNELPEHYDNVGLREYCIMPNHFHCMIELLNCDLQLRTPLYEIIRALKSFSARKMNDLRFVCDNRKSRSPVWHRSYYEHIIRHSDEYACIANYIRKNPERWKQHRNHCM
ncbi:MAG: transposase [Proteobacteria bacterium]|jgi:REP element-mobilizing transposase RayT|nr:transposase [Pseudomonadota bacterium]